MSYCNGIHLFLYAAQVSGSFNSAAIVQGLAERGTEFPSALNYVSAFSSRRFDGANGVRDIAYIDSCSCFEYTSKTIYRGAS